MIYLWVIFVGFLIGWFTRDLVGEVQRSRKLNEVEALLDDVKKAHAQVACNLAESIERLNRD